MSITAPYPQTCRAGLTRVIHEVLLPWAPITYKKARMVVATKQNTDANMTQPWIRGIGTWDEETRIHTSPPKTCRGRGRRGDSQTRRAQAQEGPDCEVTLGNQGHFTNINSVHPQCPRCGSDPFVRNKGIRDLKMLFLERIYTIQFYQERASSEIISFLVLFIEKYPFGRQGKAMLCSL